MNRSTCIDCLFCGAEFVVPVFDVCEDYAEAQIPDACPECGEDGDWVAGGGGDDRSSERRQMGIC